MRDFTRGEKIIAVGGVVWGGLTVWNYSENLYNREDFIPRIIGAATTDIAQDVAGIFNKKFLLVDSPDNEIQSGLEIVSNPPGAVALHFTIEL